MERSWWSPYFPVQNPRAQNPGANGGLGLLSVARQPEAGIEKKQRSCADDSSARVPA
jgi:hypothetical protein